MKRLHFALYISVLTVMLALLWGGAAFAQETGLPGDIDEHSAAMEGIRASGILDVLENTKQEDRINVRDYGAVGDGIADDTDAIKSAIIAANGLPVYFPEGTYNVSCLQMLVEKVILIGDGNAVIQKSDPTQLPTLDFHGCTGAVVQGLVMDGNRDLYGDDYNIALLYFRDNAENILVRNCLFRNCSREATAFYGDAENIVIHHCSFYQTSDLMWSVKGSIRHFNFERNRCNHGRTHGVKLTCEADRYSGDVHICNNYFENIHDTVIPAYNVADITVIGNEVHGANYLLWLRQDPDTKTAESVLLADNFGDTKYLYYAHDYGYPGLLCRNIVLRNNRFTLSKGLVFRNTENVLIDGDRYTMSEDGRIRCYQVQNTELRNVQASGTGSMAHLTFSGYGGIVLADSVFSAERPLLFISDGVANGLTLRNVTANFADMDSWQNYNPELYAEVRDCRDAAGKPIPAVINSHAVRLPAMGQEIGVLAAQPETITGLKGYTYEGRSVTLSVSGAGVTFAKGGNIDTDKEHSVKDGEEVTFTYQGGLWHTEKWPDDVELVISAQPQDAACNGNEDVLFSVESSGTIYRWQRSMDEGRTWESVEYSGATTPQMSVHVGYDMTGFLFRCEVSDEDGNTLLSDPASITVSKVREAYRDVKDKKPTIIDRQPSSCIVEDGEDVTLTVRADGHRLNYCWQRSKDGGATWETVPYGAGRYKYQVKFTVQSFIRDYAYRCLLEDDYGCQTLTEEVMIYYPLQIERQPQDITLYYGKKAALTLKALGHIAAYQWEKYQEGTGEWLPVPDATEKQYLFVGAPETDGLYRCTVTDADGNTVVSEQAMVQGSVEPTPEPTPAPTPGPRDLSLRLTLSVGGECTSLNDGTGVTLISPEQLVRDAVPSYGEKGDQVGFTVSLADADTKGLLMLKFRAAAAERNGILRIVAEGISFDGQYSLPAQATDYYIPLQGTKKLSALSILLTTPYQPVTVSDFELINFGDRNVDTLPTGLYLVGAHETVYAEQDAVAAGAAALLADDEYLYVLNDSALRIHQISDMRLVGQLDGLGQVREMDFCHEKQGLVITSRENGVYLVDIKEPAAPRLLAKYDTNGMATGLCVYGDYAVVCELYCGADILDISVLDQPRFVSHIGRGTEYYDCCIADGLLYISVWAERKVDVYSLDNVYAPKLVGKIALNGRGGGIVVENGLMYVATGVKSQEPANQKTDPGFGYGNGLEIWDVSDPASPRWLSWSKIDGRYQYTGADHWKVRLSGNYAAFSSVFSGVYLFDVSDPEKPERLDHLAVHIPPESKGFEKRTLSSAVFPYDVTQYSQPAVTGITFADGALFFGDGRSGTYEYKNDAFRVESRPTGELKGEPVPETAIECPEGYRVARYRCDGAIRAVAVVGDHIYAACGSAGIHLLDRELKPLTIWLTEGIVKDIVYSDGFLYTAEDDRGVAIYKVTEDGLALCGRCVIEGKKATVSSIRVLAGGKYLLAQTAWTKYALIDISDVTGPKLLTETGTGTMYFRNLAGAPAPTRLSAVSSSTRFDIISVSEAGEPQVRQMPGVYADSRNGVAMLDDENALIIYNNKIVRANLLSVTEAEWAKLPQYSIEGLERLHGKPIVFGDTLCVSDMYGCVVTVIDFTEPEHPAALLQMTLPDCPDVACMDGDTILIPLQHGGLMALIPEN